MTPYSSVLDRLNLPEGFGYALLIVALVLLLAPYLRGGDFGIVKIPDFPPALRRRLRVLGPLAMLAGILVHLPFSTPTGAVSPPIPSSLSALAPGTEVLAQRSGQCLYSATVLRSDGETISVRFASGRDADVPRTGVLLMEPKSSAPTIAEAVLVSLPQGGIWAPGTVKSVRDGRIHIDLEPGTDCAGHYPREFVLAEVGGERPLIVEDER